jgi:hypothetical protein
MGEMTSLFFFFAVLGLELRSYTLSHSPALYVLGYFRDRVLQTICPGWIWTMILMISASWVARITGVSLQCQALLLFWRCYSLIMLHTMNGMVLIQMSAWLIPLSSPLLPSQWGCLRTPKITAPFRTCLIYHIFLFFGTGAWTQGLYLEPLLQPCLVMVFFKIGSLQLFARG